MQFDRFSGTHPIYTAIGQAICHAEFFPLARDLIARQPDKSGYYELGFELGYEPE